MGTAVGKGVRPPQFARAAVRRKGLPPGAAALRAEAEAAAEAMRRAEGGS